MEGKIINLESNGQCVMEKVAFEGSVIKEWRSGGVAEEG